MSTSGTPWDGPFDMIHYPDVVKGNVIDIVKDVWSTIVSWFGRKK